MKILVIEDDLNHRKLYQMIFKKNNIDFVITDSINDALLQISNTDFDCYITDLYIKGSKDTGWKFVQLGLTPLIVCSALPIDISQYETDFNYLPKPFTSNKLLELIKKIT